MKTTRTITVDIARPASDVFEVLADLAAYPTWLDPSNTYKATVAVSDDPVVLGTTYTDRIQGMQLSGTVSALDPGRLIAFRQATPGEGLAIAIRYELTPTADGGGTRVVRTGEIETGGVLAVMHPLVVRQTVRENVRMMDALKAHLEGHGR